VVALANPPYPLLPAATGTLRRLTEADPHRLAGTINALLGEMIGPAGDDYHVAVWMARHRYAGQRFGACDCPLANALHAVAGVANVAVTPDYAYVYTAGDAEVTLALPDPIRRFIRLFDLGRWKALDYEWLGQAVAHWCSAGLHHSCGGTLCTDLGDTPCHCQCHGEVEP
jgi:hypothetical protein